MKVAKDGACGKKNKKTPKKNKNKGKNKRRQKKRHDEKIRRMKKRQKKKSKNKKKRGKKKWRGSRLGESEDGNATFIDTDDTEDPNGTEDEGDMFVVETQDDEHFLIET